MKGNTQFGIKYCRSSDSLVDFIDSDWVGDGDDQKSTYGYMFLYSIGPMVWSCKKPKLVSLSNIEA
jgi:hypothetical protein